MSRGPGHVQRNIEAAFAGSPDCAFTIEDLALIVYPGLTEIKNKHRVAIVRAIHNSQSPLVQYQWQPWLCAHHGMTIFYNSKSHASWDEAVRRSGRGMHRLITKSA
jgi:hypothetical protein